MRILFLFAFAILQVDSVPVEELRQEKENVEPEYLDMLLKEHRYEEFSKLLGIDNPRLSMPRNASDKDDPSSAGVSFVKGLFEGDIILTPQQEESARQGISFTRYKSYRWPGVVPYTVSTSYSSSDKATIQKAINTWNAELQNCVLFVPRKNESDYVQIFSGDGCYSNLGKVGGQQPISLASNGCLRQGTILHEMDHACGMIHEQSMPGRGSYVTVNYANIPEDWHPQYKEESASVFDILGPYECGSCMHYPINAPGTGKPAFSWIGNSCPNQTLVGQRQGLTAIDKSKLKKLYGCE